MQPKLFVALQLEVPHHFVERFTHGRGRRSKPPGAFGTTKTPKMLVLNPYQLTAHGCLCGCAPTLSDHMPRTRSPSKDEHSPFTAAYYMFAAENHPVGAWRKMPRGTGRVYVRQFGRSVGHPTYVEDSLPCGTLYNFASF